MPTVNRESWLHLHESVVGSIEEVLSRDTLIISINDQLLRVVNTSSESFSSGDQIFLTVVSVKPLELSLDPKRYKLRSQFNKSFKIIV